MSSFVLSGFTSEDNYTDRIVAFEDDQVFAGIESATLAARSWLLTNFEGIVEIVEIERNKGHVRRVVTASGIEEISRE
jgi:hypothetical protein